MRKATGRRAWKILRGGQDPASGASSTGDGPALPDIPGHRIVLVERGPFLSPRCDCGWYGPARRSRPLAREEAAAHLAALHPAPTDIPADTPADEGRGSPAGDG